MSSRDSARLGEYEELVSETLQKLRAERVVERMWDGDHTVWGPEPDEIANRLGWLGSPEESERSLAGLTELAEEVRAEGIRHILLLGMGGSSLAPEVFALALGSGEGYPELSILDSTDPEAVLSRVEAVDLSRTLFIVSTKSGGTVETFSFFKYFYNRVSELVGEEVAKSRFVAITDPGSGLQDTAEEYGFRATFLNNPNIGGRYSALSMFGVVPAVLIGADVPKLLTSGREAARESSSAEENPGLWLGAIMGELAKSRGRDKLTLFASPSLAPFGPWAEQLIAESTGKDGEGILPVAEEPLGSAEAYGDDRVFVNLTLAGEEDERTAALLDELSDLGHPVVEITLDDPYDLGGEMYRWEVATAIAGERLGINPFDQPNVESAKIQAREMVAEYQEKGSLPSLEPTVEDDSLAVYSAQESESVEGAVRGFLEGVGTGEYVAFQAYLPPSDGLTEALQKMRVGVRDGSRVATTLGYGPRFLHSTGQLHKGDGGDGLFVQITADHPRDAEIPDQAGRDASSLSFGVLIDAQALGDRQALLDAERRVIRIKIKGDDLEGGIARLTESLNLA